MPRTKTKIRRPEPNPRLTSIRVHGYKALSAFEEIQIGSLTVLSGANSSGKSSMMQPLLLLKQSIEEARGNDLQLNGRIFNFTDKSDILSKQLATAKAPDRGLQIGFTVNGEDSFDQYYDADNGNPLRIVRTVVTVDSLNLHLDLRANMSPQEIEQTIPSPIKSALHRDESPEGAVYAVDSSPGFLAVKLDMASDGVATKLTTGNRLVTWAWYVCRVLSNIVYVPGVRTTPSRDYLFVDQIEESRGKFDVEAASVIHSWTPDNLDGISKLTAALKDLGFTSRISTQKLNDARIRVNVSRSLRAKSDDSDMVNIADVGFGVSQVLPVIVALLDAEEGDIVYVEQPEVHLHPRAQEELARLICNTIRRGVQVVIETHSDLMLMAIQTEVASGQLEDHDVRLHWFTRDADTGISKITSAKLEKDGSFGDWPEDFSTTAMKSELAYIKSVHARSEAQT